MLRVLAVSDTHGMLKGIDPSALGCSYVAIAGDVSPCWLGYDAEMYIFDELFKWVERFPSVEFVLTPGNHDFVLDPIHDSYKRIMKEAPDNLHILIDQGWTSSDGVRFWGTPWVPKIDGHWAFESADETEEKDLDERFAMIPHGIDVLVSHSPPRVMGANVDVSMQNGRGPFGSVALTAAIHRAQPRFCVCGHVHSGDHSPVRIVNEDGDTVVYNVSRVDERYEIAYEPTVFEVESRK